MLLAPVAKTELKRKRKKDSFRYPFLIFLVVFDAFDVCKSCSLAFFGKECEPLFEQVCGSGVHLFARVAALKICQRVGVGVVLSLIDLACRYAVAEHFLDKAQGHFDGLVHFCGGVDVVPIFKVVTVAPLVVHPRVGAAKELAFAFVGASRALIIARTGNKLGGRIFGEVVEKPLPANSCTEAVPNDTMAVPCDGAKM